MYRFFFFKQKTAYEMRISDWSSDVCSSDLGVDVLKVFAVGDTYSCVDPHKMDVIDRFTWQMQNTAGVRSVLSLPQIAKQVRAGWFEGAPKWRVLQIGRASCRERVCEYV